METEEFVTWTTCTIANSFDTLVKYSSLVRKYSDLRPLFLPKKLPSDHIFEGFLASLDLFLFWLSSKSRVNSRSEAVNSYRLDMYFTQCDLWSAHLQALLHGLQNQLINFPLNSPKCRENFLVNDTQKLPEWVSTSRITNKLISSVRIGSKR